MPKVLKTQLSSFLHDYKKHVFELEHDARKVEARKLAAGKLAREILDQKFHYHVREKVDASKAEMLQMIHHYCTEALLPPVVMRLAEQYLLAEERHAVTLSVMKDMLEALAEQEPATA